MSDPANQSRRFKRVRGNYVFLLAFLLLYLILSPALHDFAGARTLLEILFAFVLIAAVFSIIDRGRLFLVAAVLTFTVLVTRWLSHGLESPVVYGIHGGLTILLLFLAIWAVLLDVLKAERVTANKIYGAICVYLLLGFVWGGRLQPRRGGLARDVSDCRQAVWGG